MQIKKYLIGIAVLFVFLLLAGAFFNFPNAHCTKIYIDINSGNVREQKFIMFFEVTKNKKTTNFSRIASEMGLIQDSPVWKIVEVRDTLINRVYIYSKWHGSVSACEKFTEFLAMKQFPPSKRKELITQAIIHLKNGEIKEIEKMLAVN